MLKDIVEVKALGGHRLFLRFEDGVEGEVDFRDRLRFDGVFASLKDPGVFAGVKVDAESGTIVWPTGADLDPDVLYAELTGTPIDIPRVPSPRTAKTSVRERG